MFPFKLETADKFEATSQQVLRSYGINLVVGHDFNEFKRLAQSARPDHTVQDLFNADVAPIPRKDAFWMVGTNSDGRIVYLQAMRLLSTDQYTLADYLNRNLHDFLPEKDTVEMARTRYRPGPNAETMRGRIVYSGEFWIDGQHPDLRGSGLSNILGRKSYLLAMQKFMPDYVFAFMLQNQAERGAFFRAAFHNIEPYAMRWCQRDTGRLMEGSMLFMSRADMEFSWELPIKGAPAQLSAA